MVERDSSVGSSILVDECFHEEDARFLEELSKLSSLNKLAAFADRWKKDPRPWARKQLLAYLDEPLNHPGHHPIIKRIFKHAEESADHELMAAFMVAFDRSVRRIRKTRIIFQSDTGRWFEEEILSTPKNSIPAKMTRTARDLMTGSKIEVPVRIGPESRLFSLHTRNYLRRRAWRYFRRMGFSRPAQYVSAISSALKRYRDADCAAGENILDNWGLMHICYQHHPAVQFTSSQANIREGASIADLQPAPYFPDLWKSAEAFHPLLSLVREARSRLVRDWAMELLRRDHGQACSGLGLDDLVALFEHEQGDVQEFASELLQSATGLEKAPLSFWLRLVKVRNPTALAIICDLMGKHVSADRLQLDQMLDLATAAPSPVAEMGLGFLRGVSFAAPENRAKLARIAEAQCPAVGAELAGFALPFFEAEEHYNRELVCEFFDSMLPEIRDTAWDWIKRSKAAYWDPMLWHRLLETPFSDLRQRIIQGLEDHPGGLPASPDDLGSVWISSIMDVHRGGRQKLRAIRQIADAIGKKPERAEKLMPLLVVAVRSIRGPERRAGLSAVMTLLEKHPNLSGKITATLPELVVDSQEVTG